MREGYLAIQQQASGEPKVIAGTLSSTGMSQLEEYLRQYLQMTPDESLQDRGVVIAPRSVAWHLFPQAMEEWTSGRVMPALSFVASATNASTPDAHDVTSRYEVAS